MTTPFAEVLRYHNGAIEDDADDVADDTFREIDELTMAMLTFSTETSWYPPERSRMEFAEGYAAEFVTDADTTTLSTST